MKVASVQLDIVWQDTAKNLQQLDKWASKAAGNGCDVIVLPELFHSGFSMQVGEIAQTMDGDVYRALSRSAQTHQIHVIAGFAKKLASQEKALNCALVFDRQGNQQACYIKNHTFDFAGEGEHFQAGSQQVEFDVDGTPCSVFICYDLRFPELFRKVVPQSEVIFVIANWPDSRQLHWEVLLQARAIENQCYVVGVNRIGEDGNGLHYSGGSMVIDPFGEVLSHAGPEQVCQMTEFPVSKVKQIRDRYPFLKDKKMQ
ncbi:nitrilase-related carbon-nitrogen hydrolase [Thiomicrorhabdus sp. ZW0627]|uniref:nitrilase-related carbon-nitrogen hydrolase n=1 Tax=Thiomicrorhabdus sp. ZW0627 TaxID=3039774 RepID=UPI0024364A52|nr:nitrilase-related carbon-nitrogen hydrolase [Thiomicrorhabdus sp. ZW0627]MDG6773438.1 nitrilase-related carbon-nitrogen hydrolase [Thiomicrorhabdus sp. ZW0627]